MYAFLLAQKVMKKTGAFANDKAEKYAKFEFGFT